MIKEYTRTIQSELSFVGEKLTRGRHKIHPYPAMLHPLLVNYLIKNYAKKNDVIFDPFCGSGVTLYQSSTNNHLSYGFDINPLAILIAKVKTQKFNIESLKNEFKDLKASIIKSNKVDIPSIKNIEYWFSPEVIQDLGKVRYILKEKKYENNDFFVVCFAYICRNQSFTRNGEFKRYRIKKEKLETIPNQVFEKLFDHIEKMIDIYSNEDQPHEKSYPILANSENGIDSKIKYDLVITSPPYGDSKTTVAYGEYSSFGTEWIEGLNSIGSVIYKVDSESIGKKGKLNPDILEIDVLNDIIDKISHIDKKRGEEVLYFFNGYYNVIKNVVTNLKKNGTVCFVVGNRTVKGYQIPMDQITASFFDKLGLISDNIYVRDIMNKVMPSKNSPSNKVGIKVGTMLNEYIVVFKKT